MGGAAFAHASAPDEPTLTTPRLTPDQYARLKPIYLSRLRAYFPGAQIACLTEAPEKESYGDMDILIALNQKVDFIAMANSIGAAGIICHSGGGTQKCTLGVPIDGTAHTRPTVIYKHVHDKPGKKREPSSVMTVDEYAQVDVAVIEPEIHAWYTFYSSYGDMAGLLGHIVYNLGFTVCDVGLRLRLEELDFSKTVGYVNVADRDGRIFLSSDPALVMQFLGLSVEDYNDGFKSVDSLYAWLGKCRLLSPEVIKVKRNNAHERNREEKREVYYRFFYEWLPAHHGTSREVVDESESDEELKAARKETIRKLRRKWCEEAIDFFNVREDYDAKQRRLTGAIENGLAAELLKPLIAEHSEKEGKSLNEIVRGFRRYVAFNTDEQPHVLDNPHADEDSQLFHFLAEDRQSFQDLDGTSKWVGEHWDELKTLERRRLDSKLVSEEAQRNSRGARAGDT